MLLHLCLLNKQWQVRMAYCRGTVRSGLKLVMEQLVKGMAGIGSTGELHMCSSSDHKERTRSRATLSSFKGQPPKGGHLLYLDFFL